MKYRQFIIAINDYEKHEISIGEAAHMAGYCHSSNVLMALKQTFGITRRVTGLDQNLPTSRSMSNRVHAPD